MNEILDEHTPAYTGKIYKPSSITWASIFGGPLAGTYMVAYNYKAFNQPDYANRTMILGGAVFLLIIIGAVMLPEEFDLGFRIIPLLTALIISLLVRRYQGDMIDVYLQNNGTAHSGSRVFAVIAISLLVAFGLGIILAVIYDLSSLA